MLLGRKAIISFVTFSFWSDGVHQPPTDPPAHQPTDLPSALFRRSCSNHNANIVHWEKMKCLKFAWNIRLSFTQFSIPTFIRLSFSFLHYECSCRVANNDVNNMAAVMDGLKLVGTLASCVLMHTHSHAKIASAEWCECEPRWISSASFVRWYFMMRWFSFSRRRPKDGSDSASCVTRFIHTFNEHVWSYV